MIKHLSEWIPKIDSVVPVKQVPVGKELTWFSTLKGHQQASKDISIIELVDIINALPKPSKHPTEMSKKEYGDYKIGLPAIKTGRYNGTGKKEVDRVYLGDYIFFDLDVKLSNENSHIYKSRSSNSRVFQVLQEVAVVAYRSPSQVGMSGVLYCPDISKYPPAAHKAITKLVYRELEKIIKRESGIMVVLDDAQSPSVQGRFIAPAYTFPIELNKAPIAFYTSATEEQKFHANKTPVYVNQGTCREGSLEDRYNKDNPDIVGHLIAAGFTPTDTRRDGYKHPATTSADSGNVSSCGGFFWCSSESYLAQTIYNGRTAKQLFPFHLALIQSGKSYSNFCKWLETEKGYALKPEEKKSRVDTAKELVKTAQSFEDIFKLCTPLLSLSFKERQEFLATANIPAFDRYKYKDYLKLKNLKINYDETYEVKNRLSEVSPQIFDLADKHKEIVIAADTGIGKTYAVVNDFSKLRPKKRLLFIAPLAIIPRQVGLSYDLVALYGSDVKPTIWDAATRADVVLATQEKAVELLDKGYKFDYIVLDEIHSFIVGNDYKSSTISRVMELVEAREIPVIGLTGTPVQQLRELGFRLIQVVKETPDRQAVTLRMDNQSQIEIVLQHQKSVKGKSLYRLQSTTDIQLLKEQFISQGYLEEEVEIYHSSNAVRKGAGYNAVSNQEVFPHSAKIVLTTSFLEEGINIKNLGFTDVVYMDSNYSGIDLSLKQLVNRFRTADPDRQLFWYAKVKNDQKPKMFNENIVDDYERLENEEAEEDTFERASYKASASLDKFFYSDGRVNRVALINHYIKRFHATFNMDERVEFVQDNYFLDVTIDSSYVHTIQDIETITNRKDALKALKTNLYLNHMEAVLNAVLHFSEDLDLKGLIAEWHPQEMLEPNEQEFVLKNIKAFERMASMYMDIKEHGEEPNDYMLNKDGSLSLTSPKWSIRKALLNDVKLIRNPKNKKDERLRIRTIKAIEAFELSGDYTQWNLLKTFKSNGFMPEGMASTNKIVRLVEYFTELEYISNRSRFDVVPVEGFDKDSRFDIVPVVIVDKTQKIDNQLTIFDIDD